MPSSGATAIDLTAIVIGTGGVTVAGQVVIFKVTDPVGKAGPASLTVNAGGVSDASGRATAVLSLGTNKTNRTLTVTATSGTAVANTTVDVTGTVITISGNSSLAFNNNTTLTFSLKDSAGAAITSGVTLSVTSGNGNTVALTPATGITDGTGQITANITANKPGNDVITATGGGTSKTQALTVSADAFAFTAPVAATQIPLSTATPVSINWTTNGVPIANGSLVNFSASRGVIVGSPAATAGGVATVSISSTSAGPAIISAAGPGGTPAATLSVVFVATSATSVTVQAVPSTIQFTTGSASQTSNSSTISVVVRDAVNNLVKNAGVDFTITADPSGGTLTSARAITDVSGSATVTYIAGATSSPSNGVVISATVTDISGLTPAPLPLTSTAALTVSGQSLLVRLGTDNLVVSAPPLNRKTWAAIVTDAAGNAVPNATVSFSLRPGTYRKGFYSVPPGGTAWAQTVSPTVPFPCPNEDLNFNGIVDPLEDTNGNGSLEPGGIATVNATAQTDPITGVANAVITYPKDHATWTQVILEARTGVAGNDPPALATFYLEGLASDYTDINVFPPGRISPYGVSTLCTDTL